MINFDDILKISKQIALYFSKQSIDIRLVQVAMNFLAHDQNTQRLSQQLDAMASPDNPSIIATSKSTLHADDKSAITELPGGAILLATYPAEPRMTLADNVAALRKEQKAAAPAYALPVGPALSAADQDALTRWAKSLGHSIRAAQDNKQVIALQQQLDHLWARLNTTAQADSGIFVIPSSEDKPDEATRITNGLKTLAALLEERLLGQPLASRLLLESLYSRHWGLSATDMPQCLLIMGPPGTGKSLTVDLLAQSMPGRPRLTLNMGSFQSENEGFGLTGLRRGYNGAASGRLTSFVHDNPDAIVVFDNIDQAHPRVQELLIPLFTDGYLTDEYGFDSENAWSKDRSRVSFANTTLVFTTNSSLDIYDRPDFQPLYDQHPDQLVAQLREVLGTVGPDQRRVSPRLAAYLGMQALLPFQRLDMETYVTLARSCLQTFESSLRRDGVELAPLDSDRLAWLLVTSTGPSFSATELSRDATASLGRAYVADAMANNGTNPARHLSVEIAPSLVLDNLMAEKPADVMHRFFRRGEVLHFSIKPERQADRLTLKIDDIALGRVAMSADYGESGRFEITLPTQKFADIYGHEFVKSRLAQIARVLRLMERGETTGLPPDLPRGLLLSGAPGTGKTMLARALAAEAEVPFIAVTGSQLLNLSIIAPLFARARRFAPSIVFIDEIDALGVRGQSGIDPCINQLLTEIDGVHSGGQEGRVFVVAATNFPQKVDPALTRSGRLDMHIEVPILDREARRHFMNELTSLPHSDEWHIEDLLDLTAGLSGADMARVRRECLLDMMRQDHTSLSQADVIEQINVVKYGAPAPASILRERLRATAYHEAGHALASYVLTPWRKVEQVSIVPRGQALGFTAYYSGENGGVDMDRRVVLNIMSVALAGRLAETRFSQPSAKKTNDVPGQNAGASSDIASAFSLAWQAITEWGLDDSFGWTSLESLPASLKEIYAADARARVTEWMEAAANQTRIVLDAHWSALEEVAEKLLTDNVITFQLLKSIIEGKK